MDSHQCFVHFSQSTSPAEKLTVLSKARLANLKECASLWVTNTAKEPERTVSTTFRSHEREPEKQLHYHNRCYLRLASRDKIAQASKRKVSWHCLQSVLSHYITRVASWHNILKSIYTAFTHMAILGLSTVWY